MPKTLTKSDLKSLSLYSLGGALEFYNFIIFIFFANYISTSFFPSELDDFWKLLGTYTIFATGYLAKPFAKSIKNYFKTQFYYIKAQNLNIILIMLSTFSLAFIPTFESIGYFSLVILLFIRILQGLAISKEFTHAWSFVKRHSPDGKDGFCVSSVNVSMMAGVIFACLVTLAIHQYFVLEEIYAYAWRSPFIVGGFLSMLLLYFGKTLKQNFIIQKIQHNHQENFTFKDLFKSKKDFSKIVATMLLSWMLTACVIILTLLMPNFIPEVLILEKIDALLIQIIALVILSCGTLLAGIWVDKFGFLITAFIFAIGFSFSCFLYFYFFYAQILHLSIYCYFIACFFGGINALAPILICKIFNPDKDLTKITFSYNIAYAIAGFFTPQLVFILHSLAVKPDEPFIYGIFTYTLILSLMSLLIAIFTYKKLRL
ncbi:MFS transporter [Campylobacter sp. 2014D-0216]|uniref:MFS transporter n=1 Tax=Campylobacter sp. 2014D-0216 TaxID=1813595 RepID=UPI0018A5E886|nr:MFS transporter [Campylobacter sp. 2014D-0216]QOR01278.1 MFS transporter [Campylobacter sp. 2014D-0216]